MMNRDEFRLGVRQISELMKDDFCPRCFWLRNRFPLKWPNPFHTSMPRVISSLDSQIKELIRSHFESHGRLPLWLEEKFPYGVIEIIKVAKFEKPYKRGQVISGFPDAIWKLEDRSYCIVDFKLAKFDEKQQSWLPVYELQVNLYAYLSDLNIDNLFLIYIYPNSEISDHEIEVSSLENYSENLNKNDLILPFNVEVKLVRKLNIKVIEYYIDKAFYYLSQHNMPQGRKGCKGCEELSRWIEDIAGQFRQDKNGKQTVSILSR